MAWTTLTAADIEKALNQAELELYRQHVNDADEDPVPTILADVTAEVRGYVVTKYPLESAGLPHGLKNAALDLVIYRLAKRLHSKTEEQRKTAADDAVALLQRVSEGNHGIEDMGTTISASSSGGSAVRASRTNPPSSSTLNGL